MGRKWRVVALAVESVAMAMAYGMMMVSYFWELYRFMVLLLITGVFLNIMIILRTRRQEWR